VADEPLAVSVPCGFACPLPFCRDQVIADPLAAETVKFTAGLGPNDSMTGLEVGAVN